MNKIGFLTLLIMASLVLMLGFPASAASPKAPLPVAPAVAVARRLHRLQRLRIHTFTKDLRPCAPPSVIWNRQHMISKAIA